MTTPLRSSGETSSPTSPEALTISAFLESGHFNPHTYGLTEDHLDCWRKLWRFATEYEQASGQAPTLQLIAKRFPDFEYTPSISLSWAVGQLRREAASRDLRHRIREALTTLNEHDDVNAAFDAFEGLQRPRGGGRRAVDAFDTTLIADEVGIEGYPVPYPTLARAVECMRPSELWYMAARPGQGKSNTATHYIKPWLVEGLHVGVLSLEMRAAKWAQRANRTLAFGNRDLQARLSADDEFTRKEAIEELQATIPGKLSITDLSHGIITVETVRSMLDYHDIVVIDHVGLLRTTDGRRPIDDWRIMATVSNQLREETLATSVPIFGIAHLNRTGESNGASTRAPRAGGAMAQSDALYQDPDVLITMRRLSKHVMAHSAEKTREGEELKWFSHYNPARGDYREVPRDRAMEIRSQDDVFDDEI